VKSLIKNAFAICLVLIFLSAATIGYVRHWSSQPLGIVEKTRVELASGQPFSAFAGKLAAAGIVEHPRLWSWDARLRGLATRVQAGEYSLAPGDTPDDLLQALLSGDVIFYEVQLIEGWTVTEVLGILAADTRLEHELGGADEQTLLGALGLPQGHAEGLFFPDTYRYERGTSDADVLMRAYDKMQSELSSHWRDRDVGLPYDTPYQALIAASLVEKETGREADRPQIAQVFATRLQKGMRLQTDPSVIYGLGAGFDGNLTRRHLRTDTPYNTYTRRGLPPTPIALPSLRSIQAALHPAGGDYLYFVSRGDGTSQFSTSLAEHEAAVRKYQLR